MAHTHKTISQALLSWGSKIKQQHHDIMVVDELGPQSKLGSVQTADISAEPTA